MAETEIRRLDIERYAAGELEDAEKSRLEEHLETCAACSGYLARVEQESEKFLAEHPFGSLRWLAERNVRQPWHARLTSAFAIPVLRPVIIPLCLLVFVGVLVIPFIPSRDANGPASGIVYKGKQTLSYIYKRNSIVHEAAPTDRFSAGDAIQIFYASAAERSLSLLSIDGRGTVSFYQPDEHSAQCSIRSGVGSRLAYPRSIVLDATPGDELVVALFTDEPLTAGTVEHWVAKLNAASGSDLTRLESAVRANPLGAKSTVATLMLRKG